MGKEGVDRGEGLTGMGSDGQERIDGRSEWMGGRDGWAGAYWMGGLFFVTGWCCSKFVFLCSFFFFLTVL